MRRLFPVAALLACLSAPAAAHAQARVPDDPPSQVMLSGDVVVAKGRVVGEVVVLHGSATIQGVVDGDVVVFDGPIVVAGQVSGAVVAVDGDVTLQSTAQVVGDVIAGDTVRVADGATVEGTIREGVDFSLAGPLTALGALLAPVAVGVSVLLMLLLLVLLAPRGSERVAEAAGSAPLASGLWGFGLLGILPAAAVLASLTILGLPFGLALLLGLGLVWLVGQAWTTWVLGRLIVRAPGSRVGAVFVGWAIGAAVGLVPGLNAVWWTLGSAFGLGAMTVATWRARRGVVGSPLAPRPDAVTRDTTKGGRHRAGRVTPAPRTALPETPLGED